MFIIYSGVCSLPLGHTRSLKALGQALRLLILTGQRREPQSRQERPVIVLIASVVVAPQLRNQSHVMLLQAVIRKCELTLADLQMAMPGRVVAFARLPGSTTCANPSSARRFQRKWRQLLRSVAQT
jgi:hypothetical protein